MKITVVYVDPNGTTCEEVLPEDKTNSACYNLAELGKYATELGFSSVRINIQL